MIRCPFAPGCEGRLQLHHCVPRRTIKNQHLSRNETWDLGEALRDPRNLIALCDRHHQLVTNHRIYVERWHLPDGIDEFAAQFNLGWYISRTFDHENRRTA